MGASKTRLADRVAADLQNLIFTEYKAGDQLPVENELAQQFSVSRITIREAISKLSTMGIIDVRQGEGTFVKQLAPASFMRPMLPMLSLCDADYEDILEVRLLIECSAVESAAQRATGEELELLKTSLDNMENAVLSGELRQYNEYDVDFHNQIARYSHNQVIAIINELIIDMIKESIFYSCNTSDQVLNSVIYHNRIYKALIERDAEQASRLMKEHLSGALAFIKKKASEKELC